MKIPNDSTLRRAFPYADFKMLKDAFNSEVAKSKQKKGETAKSNISFYAQLEKMVEKSSPQPGRGCYTREIPFV